MLLQETLLLGQMDLEVIEFTITIQETHQRYDQMDWAVIAITITDLGILEQLGPMV